MWPPVQVAIAFSDNSRLITAWIAPDVTKDNKHTSPKWGDAAHVHLVVIDAETGQKQKEKEWPTTFTYPAPTLAGTHDGQFLVCTDDAVRVLSPTLDTVHEEQLTAHSGCSLSPSGNTLLVSTLSPSEHKREVNIIDTKTFKVISSWTEQSPAYSTAIAISDHWLLGYCGKPSVVCIRRFNEEWHPFRVAGQERRTSAGASFINNETIGIGGKSLTLTTVDGVVMSQISPSDKRSFGSRPEPSSNGESFAILEGRMRGVRNEGLDMYPFFATDQATVYDTKDSRPLFSLKLQGTSPWTPWHVIHNVVALSPDGGSVAVISDGVLEMFGVVDGNKKQ